LVKERRPSPSTRGIALLLVVSEALAFPLIASWGVDARHVDLLVHGGGDREVRRKS
jgi:hypothetical protein